MNASNFNFKRLLVAIDHYYDKIIIKHYNSREKAVSGHFRGVMRFIVCENGKEEGKRERKQKRMGREREEKDEIDDKFYKNKQKQHCPPP